jgi:uncharacterized phage protein gp47/JayE
VQALDSGTIGNIVAGAELAFVTPIAGVTDATVIDITGGVDEETDDELRARVLRRIRQPPMGGSKTDYEAWALAVPGVTRSWCGPREMGMGTVTLRFLMDNLRADDDGWPNYNDIQLVSAYIDTVRPVAVKDMFVVAPVKQRVDCIIDGLVPDTEEVRAQIEKSVRDMLFQLAAPGQTIFAAWKTYAIMNAPGVQSFRLQNALDDQMESPGHMAVLGDLVYE